jgi:DNA-directed RNA polymerase specialized sigma24 family protein
MSISSLALHVDVWFRDQFSRTLHWLHYLANQALRVYPAILGKENDFIQQVLLKSWECRMQFQGTTEPEWFGWVRRIAMSVASDWLRT